MGRVMSLSELQKKLNVMPQTVKKELDRATKEDSEYLKLKIYESFDEVSDTPIHGYYLEGAGPTLPYRNTDAFEGEYHKKWQRPLIKSVPSNNGYELQVIGSDARILEYGLSPLSSSPDMLQFNLHWINNSEEGYYNAHNSWGEGNWYEAISLLTGNTSPLLSYGEKGGRFFVKYSTPTMFVRKAAKKYEDAVKSNSASVKFSANGVKVMIEKELNK